MIGYLQSKQPIWHRRTRPWNHRHHLWQQHVYRYNSLVWPYYIGQRHKLDKRYRLPIQRYTHRLWKWYVGHRGWLGRNMVFQVTTHAQVSITILGNATATVTTS